MSPLLRRPSLGVLGSAIAKRKNQFYGGGSAQPASRPGAHPDSSHSEQYGGQNMDEVISQVIFQAGVDFETRPIVVMNASAFPDPHSVSYDHLLSLILSYLELFVESDYTVVFFAAGGRYTPSWNWVWKAYRSLGRKFRKNLKQLYIVHSSLFSKMLFSLAGAIISPKFFRKITYTDTLSALALHVPLTQIDIPPAAYAENLKHEARIIMPTTSHSHMFGVSLEQLMGHDGEKGGLPRVVRDCIQYLRETGLEDEGLFRRSPRSVQLRQVREAYDRGQMVSLRNFRDPHLAAVLLKKFLHDLPDPIFTERTYDIIRRCPKPQGDQQDIAAIMYIRNTLLPELEPCKMILLSNVLLLLHEVSLRSDKNRMDAHNLAIVITPNLLCSGNPVQDVVMFAVDGAPALLSPVGDGAKSKTNENVSLGTVVKLCVHRYFEIFDELADHSKTLAADPFLAQEETGLLSASSSHGDSRSALPATATGGQDSEGSNYGISGKRSPALHGDGDSIDDAMLVMPIGPESAGPPERRLLDATSTVLSSSTRPIASGNSRGAQRLAEIGSLSSAKARKLLGVSSSVSAPASTSALTEPKSETYKSGTAADGSLRKSSGAAVTAHNITASGFFTPPSNDQGRVPGGGPLPPPKHPMSLNRAEQPGTGT